MKKQVKKLILVFLFCVKLIFLLAILFDKKNDFMPFLIVSSILLLLAISFKKGIINHKDYTFDHFNLIFFVFAGSLSTYYLKTNFEIGSILSATVVGLIASFVPNILKKSELVNQIPTAVYCGAFVGMSNSIIAPNLVFIFIASGITGTLLISSKNILKGVGGKFGTLAFGGVIMAFCITFIMYKWI